MRVLWLCNIMLPAFAESEGLPYSNREGWLSGSFDRILLENANGGARQRDGFLNIDLGVCFPVPEAIKDCHKVLEGVDFYGFRENLDHPEIYDRTLETRFAEVLEDFRPDIVHIFGSEFPHALAMVRAFRNPTHTLVGIQGLCCSIADSYMADLPYKVQRRATFRDRLRGDSLREQQHKFRIRARMEAQTIQHTAHITGRTEFDRRVTGDINPDARYHVMNETMRSNFYTGTWDPDKVEQHSIFISQGDYPLKGFHFMLQAMPAIIEKFPDAKLYVAGTSIIGNVGGVKAAARKYPMPLWITSYGKYLRQLIHDNDLKGHVIMLGKLSADEMKERYLKSNVFVCPSIMENSPNALCEAMLLGLPCVAAKVGGVPDLLSDGEDGILFPGGKTDELAEGVITVMYDSNLSSVLGSHAKRTAMVTHNPDTNFKRLLEIYRSMMS